ncbi:unnamed protein product [Durusdinium trenchii]|uniref:Transmembrane protein n=1 Tax=Durusdinium trenchii TaxID=1381693 RepID=A0ABP0QP60_9DINO
MQTHAATGGSEAAGSGDFSEICIDQMPEEKCQMLEAPKAAKVRFQDGEPAREEESEDEQEEVSKLRTSDRSGTRTASMMTNKRASLMSSSAMTKAQSFIHEAKRRASTVSQGAEKATQLMDDLDKRGLSCFQHLGLALLGGLGQTKRSLAGATKSSDEDSCSTFFVYLVVIVGGHLFVILLPIALIAFGLAFVVAEGPTIQDIDEIVRVPGKQPYWMVLITSIIAAASTNAILGPPRLRSSRKWWKSFAKVGKQVLLLYLLGRTIYTWFQETGEFLEIARKQLSAGFGFPSLLRTGMLAMVQYSSSSQWGRYVDQLALLLVFNDYLNFKAAHQPDFCDKWSEFMEAVQKDDDEDDDDKGPLWRAMMIPRPFSDEEDIHKAFAPSMLAPKRLVALIRRASKSNGPIWAIYMVVLLARCWSFGWLVGLVYFPLFSIIYCWVIAIILFIMIALRWLIVEPSMRLLIYRRGKGDSDTHGAAGDAGKDLSKDEDAADGAGPGSPNLRKSTVSGSSYSVTSTPSNTTVGTAGSISVNGHTIEKYPEPEEGAKEEKLKIVASAMASTGFLPGNFDRAVPFLLHTTWYSETWAGSLRKNYNREMHVLGVTGITRDGWCYIVIYAAVGKVMVDFMVVAMSRLLAGAGYLDSLVLTITDRSWESFLEQFEYMDTYFNQVLAWVQTIW